MSIHLSIVRHLGCSLLLWSVILWTWMWKYLFEILISILLDIEVKLMVYRWFYFNFWETSILFSTAVMQFCTPTNNTIIPKKSSHCCESSRAHNRFPNQGIQQRAWELPRKLTLKTSGIWLQSFHRTGEIDSWRAQTKPCMQQNPGERKSDPTRDWARLACECPGGSSGGLGLQWPSGDNSPGISPFKEDCHFHHYPYHSWASVQTTGTVHSPTHQNNIELKIYWAWPHPSE